MGPRWFLHWLYLVFSVAAGGASGAFAADARPAVGPGATREEVINAYGWPSGQSQSGAREVLNYPQGKVTLEQGRVERVDFSMNVPWPAPRPRPAAPSPTSAKKGDAPVDFWVTSFDEASREASRRNARILALFTGSDWSPASRQFSDEVEFHPDFINAFTGDFVFLRLDFVTRAQQSPAMQAEHTRLRERYNVTTYPSLLVLSPAGTVVAQVDLAKAQAGDTYRARVIAAVREVRDLLVVHPPPPDPVAATAALLNLTAPEPVKSNQPPPLSVLTETLRSAGWLVIAAIIVGFALMLGVFWLMWRKSVAPAAVSMSSRISDAASGLPSQAEFSAWSRERLAVVVSALAESDGYAVEVRGADDVDLVLRRPAEPKPRVLVTCADGKVGAVAAKRVRELFGAMTVEDVPVGWFATTATFSEEARLYAEKNGVVLINGPQLLRMMRDLPAMTLTTVLAKAAAQS